MVLEYIDKFIVVFVKVGSFRDFWARKDSESCKIQEECKIVRFCGLACKAGLLDQTYILTILQV